jgi:murein DD-endopeptidase
MRLTFVVCHALLASAAISCWAPSLAVEQHQTGQPSAVPPGALIYRDLPVHIDARPSPTPVRGDDGARYLVYRVFVTNWSERDLTFQGFDVLDAESGRVLARYDTTDLANPRRQRSTLFITSDPRPENRTLATGRTAIIAVHFALDAFMPEPRGLRHRVTFEPDSSVAMQTDSGAPSPALIAESGVLGVDQRTPPVLSPPLRGGSWRCNNGLALSNGHASLYPFRDSWLRVPQRFGCDFSKVDAQGDVLPSPFPDEINNAMFYGYGAEVLSVADGVISYVQDGIPENVPRADGQIVMPLPLTNATVSGNWVALDLWGGRYAFYAHLQPGSIRVRVGQRVRRGEVIGLLGNSGNSVGPHLHFHVGDGNSLNGSEGQPYVFERFVFLGRGRPETALPGNERRNALPLEGAVLAFPDP